MGSQSYADVEHIIIDGARRHPLDVISDYKTKIDRFISEPDDGIYDAMNKGLQLATGDIIGLLNADDVYANQTVLERVVGKMQMDDLDAAYGDVEYFRGSDVDRPIRRYRSARFRPDLIAHGWMPAHPTLFLRRGVYKRFGTFRTDYRIAGDFEFVARIFRSDSLRYAYLPEILVRMRMGGASTGGIRNTILLNREVLRACRENDIPTNMLKIMSKYPMKLMEFLK